MSDQPSRKRRLGLRRLLARIMSVLVFGWLGWAAASGWSWLAVSVGTVTLAGLTVFKNAYWTMQSWNDAASQLGRPNLAKWLPLGVIGFNLLLALTVHGLTRAAFLVF